MYLWFCDILSSLWLVCQNQDFGFHHSGNEFLRRNSCLNWKIVPTKALQFWKFWNYEWTVLVLACIRNYRSLQGCSAELRWTKSFWLWEHINVTSAHSWAYSFLKASRMFCISGLKFCMPGLAFGCQDLYSGVWTCIWVSGVVLGCLDLCLGVWTCNWVFGLVFGCLGL